MATVARWKEAPSHVLESAVSENLVEPVGAPN